MNRLTPKFALMISAFLLGMNFVTGAAMAVTPCPPSICCRGPMHMDAGSDMINFALPTQKCCDDCDNIFCGLLNDPLQDVKTVQPAPELGYSQTLYAANGQALGISYHCILDFNSSHAIAFEMVFNQIPLYIEHLSLII